MWRMWRLARHSYRLAFQLVPRSFVEQLAWSVRVGRMIRMGDAQEKSDVEVEEGGPSKGRAAGGIEREPSWWCALRRFPRWIIETPPDRCHKRKAAERLKWRAFAFLIHYARGRFSPCPAPRRGLSWGYTKTSCHLRRLFLSPSFLLFFLFFTHPSSQTRTYSHIASIIESEQSIRKKTNAISFFLWGLRLKDPFIF